MHTDRFLLMLTTALAFVPAQAEVATECLATATTAFANRQTEDAVAALVQAWLAIDAIAEGEAKRQLGVRADELRKGAPPLLSASLQFARTVEAGLAPAIRELLDARQPTMARRLTASVPATGARRHASAIAEAEAALDAKQREADQAVASAFQFTLAATGGDWASTAQKVLPQSPKLHAWLAQGETLASTAAKVANDSLALAWYQTASLHAQTAIELSRSATVRAPCEKILQASSAGLVEVRYRTQAKVHMDAFRSGCRKLGDSLDWDFDGSVWRTPWRGSRAIAIAGKPLAGDLVLEVDVDLTAPGSRLQLVLAWLDDRPQPEYCAIEVELLNARQSAQVRLLHVQGETSRVLAETKAFVGTWNFHRMRAELAANRVSASVGGEVVAADLPFAREPDRATRFGFAVPQQEGRKKGKARDKTDVIGIRNLVVHHP